MDSTKWIYNPKRFFDDHAVVKVFAEESSAAVVQSRGDDQAVPKGKLVSMKQSDFIVYLVP